MITPQQTLVAYCDAVAQFRLALRIWFDAIRQLPYVAARCKRI